MKKRFIFTLSTVFLILTAILTTARDSIAIDFDQDGFDDFILVDVKKNDRLQWFALDLNDSIKRPLGQFGRAGDHLAVGEWAGNKVSSKALIKKRSNGEFEWTIQLPGGQRTLNFGKAPDTVISGLDMDNNGAIDAATVSRGDKTLSWKVILNPVQNTTAAVQEYNFGGKRELPFFANIDGNGDKLAVAKLAKGNKLSLKFFNTADGQSKTININNYNSKLTRIIPAARANGKDAIFAISKTGKKINVSVIHGNKKVKSINVTGDEMVVGKYLGTVADVLLIRGRKNKAVLIDAGGKKSTINIDLSGVLADSINVNTFSKAQKPPKNNPANPDPEPTLPPSPPSPPSEGHPVCSGVAISTEHMLYKPISDTTGNVVLVFDSKYSREFLSVKIELKDGSFAEGWWKGLELWGNPDAFGNRQHWRTNVRSHQVKDRALIIVDDTSQECRFQLPGSANNRWE